MQRFYHRKPTGKFYRINQYIQAPRIRLIGPDGKQIGIVSKWEGLQKAREFELDLVEVAPAAKPPVVRIIDFKKFRYLEAKKEKEAKKSSHEQELKEIRLGPFTAQGDIEVKTKRAREFLTEGNRLKMTVIFHGREITRKEFGFDIVNKIIRSLADVSKVEQAAKMEGRQLITILIPLIKK